MAGVYIPELKSGVDYSLPHGEVETFTLNGEVLFDAEEGIAVEGWKLELAKFVLWQGWLINDGHGLHAFVYTMLEDGDFDGEEIKRWFIDSGLSECEDYIQAGKAAYD